MASSKETPTLRRALKLAVLLASSFSAGGVAGASVFRHKWDTVADLMAMHGQCQSTPPPSVLDFAANNYGCVLHRSIVPTSSNERVVLAGNQPHFPPPTNTPPPCNEGRPQATGWW